MIYPKFSFDVGENERHKVYFEIDFATGISVYVDGDPTFIQGRQMDSVPFSVQVGDEEKHTVTFQVSLSQVYPLISHKKVQVTIDGKIFKTF